MNPAKMLRYCGPMNENENAVTAGQSLQLFMKDTGTVRWIRSQASASESPERSDCMPKKYELKMGVKASWLTMTLVLRDRSLEV